MPLTRSFRETVQARARRDIKFRQALLGEAMQALLDGNLEEGRAALALVHQRHDRFRKTRHSARPIAQEPDAHVRAVGQSHRRKSAGVIGVLQAKTGVRLQVRAVADAA